MADSGGPEDPQVEKLRQQLAAAERAADLRAQLAEARDELAEVTELLGENVPVGASEQAIHGQKAPLGTRIAGGVVLAALIAVIVGGFLLWPESNSSIIQNESEIAQTTALGDTDPQVAAALEIFLSYLQNSDDYFASSASSRATTTTSVSSNSNEVVLMTFYGFGEKSERIKNLQGTIYEVTGDYISADGNYGPGTREQHIAALNKLGLSTSNVPAVPAAAAPRATTATATTLPPNPQYLLPESSNGYFDDPMKNSRWDPCGGPIRIGIMPNDFFTVPQLQLKHDFFTNEAALLSRLTGLNVIYVGQVDNVKRDPSTGRILGKFYGQHPDAEILFRWRNFSDSTMEYRVPDLGDESMLSFVREEFNFRWSRSTSDGSKNTDPNFYALAFFNFVVNAERIGHATDTRHLKYSLLRAMGLDHLRNGPKTEILTWGADGAGSYGDPQYGAGDKIGLGLVGASNGCF